MAIPDVIEAVEGTVFGHIVTEMRTRPFTMILILAMAVGLYLLWSAQTGFAKTFAKTEDLNRLRVEVIEVKYSVEKASLESQMRTVDEEYFRLERQSTDMKSVHKDVPELYAQRMSQLKTDKEALKVDLDAVQKHINQITAPPSVLVTAPSQ